MNRKKKYKFRKRFNFLLETIALAFTVFGIPYIG